MADLALLGGKPLIDHPLPRYQSIGDEEEKAVTDVIRTGCLSGFYGSWQSGFLGGPKVLEFEKAWAKKFGTKHAISVNSNTSGLYAALGAVSISPGDEVIVPCTTMSATAMAPLIYGAIPVFVDIDEDTFCLKLDSVRNNLTKKTKAIIAVNLFGHAAPLHELRKLCDEKGFTLIEDNAQAPLATEYDKYCGTIGHIGVFSLNYHKHIHTGEGGMCCTDDDVLGQRLQMIRNHAEAVVEGAQVDDLTNMVGFNYRMTELSAAVGLVQLENIEAHIRRRKFIGESLTQGVEGLRGISTPQIRNGCTHVYYGWVLRYNSEIVGPSRTILVKALNAEGFPCSEGYVRPLYLLPLFLQRKAIGRHGYPFNLTKRTYAKGLCPTAERLYQNELIVFQPCAWNLDGVMIERLIETIHKVWKNCGNLKDFEDQGSN